MKKRLDVLLTERGYFESRTRAQASIMAGTVYVDGQKSDKAGMKYPEDAVIEVREEKLPYVSRGGFKLEQSIREFGDLGLSVEGKVCADLGASTGGFTDCMLQNGASKVYAVDVGYGQLAWKLRTDPRVVNIERCNVRYMGPEEIPEPVQFVSIDVSFISLKLILPTASRILTENGTCVCLVKPQFEAGREEMKNTKGVVRDPAVRTKAILDCAGYAEANGFTVCGLTYSPVRGTKGNVEFLLYLRKGVVPKNEQRYNESVVSEIVMKSHNYLENQEPARD